MKSRGDNVMWVIREQNKVQNKSLSSSIWMLIILIIIITEFLVLLLH